MVLKDNRLVNTSLITQGEDEKCAWYNNGSLYYNLYDMKTDCHGTK